MRRFHEDVLDYCDLLSEENEVCSVENLSFPSFAKLMEVARCTNEPVCKSSKSGMSSSLSQASIDRQMQMKRPIYAAHDEVG